METPPRRSAVCDSSWIDVTLSASAELAALAERPASAALVSHSISELRSTRSRLAHAAATLAVGAKEPTRRAGARSPIENPTRRPSKERPEPLTRSRVVVSSTGGRPSERPYRQVVHAPPAGAMTRVAPPASSTDGTGAGAGPGGSAPPSSFSRASKDPLTEALPSDDAGSGSGCAIATAALVTGPTATIAARSVEDVARRRWR